MSHSRSRIGIDLGGSKIEVLALSPQGAELFRQRFPTPQGDYPGTLNAVVQAVQLAEQHLRATGVQGPSLPTVGIGIPGAESRLTGLIKNANSTCLIGQPLRRDLEAALGREVRIANDANCFALSEATDGAGAGAEVVFGVIIGTGVGGGIVVRGHVLAGVNGICGEWGHNAMPGEAGDESCHCYCGRMNCIELYLSGGGLARDHRRAASADFLQEVMDLSPIEIVARSRAGDAACEASLQRYEQRLARALAGVINILDPDVIVLGGGLSNIDRLYENIPRLWQQHVFSDYVATRLSKPRHGDSSGVRGAAWLWNDLTDGA